MVLGPGEGDDLGLEDAPDLGPAHAALPRFPGHHNQIRTWEKIDTDILRYFYA